MTQQEIISAFDEYIKKSKCQYYNQLYVGVTNNPERRVFTEHNVKKEGQWWVFALADDESIARGVERHYLDLGMIGDKGGGNGTGDCRYVYCYVITPDTNE